MKSQTLVARPAVGSHLDTGPLEDAVCCSAVSEEMVGLSRHELPPASLYAGDIIEYCSRAFVSGDKRGLRQARVLRIAQHEDSEFPVHLDTEEPLPLTNLVKLVYDWFGNRFKHPYALWRKLRTYTMVDGTVDGPTRASVLADELRHVVADSIEAVRALRRGSSEEINQRDDERTMSGGESPPSTSTTAKPSSLPSTTVIDLSSGDLSESDAGREDGVGTSEQLTISDESSRRTTPDTMSMSKDLSSRPSIAVINLCGPDSGDSDAGHQGSAVASERLVLTEEPTAPPSNVICDPTEEEIVAAHAEFMAIPTHAQRDKIRHQRKNRAGDWHVSKSRKKSYQDKRAPVRDTKNLYHAKNIKAKNLKAFIRAPSVAARLQALREARPLYVDPNNAKQFVRLGGSVQWPEHEVDIISECRIPEGLAFPDVGDFGCCSCIGDCFRDVCHNAVSAVFCTEDTCNLKAECSNAPKVLTTLRLFKTPITGIGVYTTTKLEAGDMVGEYAGQLCAYDALVEGQPEQTMKYNSGYTLFYTTKSTTKKYVYVEAVGCGTITRFINHACRPNALFVEMRNHRAVKVIVILKLGVEPGTEITVNYGNDKGFKCKCNDCLTR